MTIESGNIVVAIRCTIFNHEPYIRQCLDGFVMQKTNFPFVAIVHDDCSTDGSAEIIREYAQKYPDIIKPIFESENQYSKRDGSLQRIMRTAIEATRCKYVAMCEGDDYWTDPYKLQKQVDFLEAHSDYSICFSRVQCLQVATSQLGDELIVQDKPGKSTILDLACGNYIHTPSVVFRYSMTIERKISALGYCMPSDYVFWMLYAEQGKIWKMDEPMAVYRVGSGMWSSDNSIKPDVEMLMTLHKLWMAIENTEVKNVLQEQILRKKKDVLEYTNHLQHDLNTIRASKAYRIGKWLLRSFKWLKK